MFAALLVLLQFIALPGAVSAQSYGARLVSSTSWIEEWDPASQSWVRIGGPAEMGPASTPVTTITTHIVNGKVVSETVETSPAVHNAARYAVPLQARHDQSALAQYGPFQVRDPQHALLLGSTDSASPGHFDAMLRDHPGLEVLEMVEAPGTRNDIANLELGRRIRAAGLATHVPDGGSVRSGAVELFLAGERRSIAPGAVFAVHSWLDNYGREAADIAADAPEHRLYLDYYVEMGMSEARAREFYAMTNSVPHAQALWLQANDMRAWIAPEPFRIIAAEMRGALPVPVLRPQPIELAAAPFAAPQIAYVVKDGFAGL